MSLPKFMANQKKKAKPNTPKSAIRAPYTMTKGSDGIAEVILYGDIVESRPVDWWTGEPIEGSFIILSEFLEDLKKVESEPKIRIRIHSAGGNAWDAITIHNRIKELSAGGMEIECIIDGVAMSGGSLIMCACDTVKVFPGSLIMIHKCWAFLFGGCNADELRKYAESLDGVDRAQAAIYNVKTSKTENELLSLMSAETYMTGREALDKGFADEIVQGTALDISASADRKTLYVCGMPVWESCRDGGIPPHVNIPVFSASANVADDGINNNQPAKSGGIKGGNPMTLEELKKKHPELVSQLTTEVHTAANAENKAEDQAESAIEAERQRIKAIDEIAGLFDAETVQAAKYGDKPCTAQEMTYNAAINAANKGTAFMNDLKADAANSGASKVEATSGNKDADTGEKTEDQKKIDAKVLVKNLLGKKEE